MIVTFVARSLRPSAWSSGTGGARGIWRRIQAHWHVARVRSGGGIRRRSGRGRGARCSLASRSARYLLLALDNCSGNTFYLTHESLAQMLGVRRAGVTNALSALQVKGIIKSHRGQITIVSRNHLEAQACECGPIIRARYSSTR